MPNNRALRLFINLRKSLNFRKSMKVAFRIAPPPRILIADLKTRHDSKAYKINRVIIEGDIHKLKNGKGFFDFSR